MKRVKRIAVVVLSLSLIIVFAGCGCQNNSNENNSNSTTQDTKSTNTSQSDDSKSSTKTANSDFEPTISLEQRKAVKTEDYINGNTFDLTDYAEALGFTHLTDPSYPEIAFYAIKRGNTYCLFSYGDPNLMVAWFDNGDGCVYRTSAESIATNSEYTITSKNQKDRKISREGIERIEKAMRNISTDEEIDMQDLQGFTHVEKHTGPAAYLENGLLKVREIGGIVESFSAHGNQ